MNSTSKQVDPILNEKIAAIREKNTKLENRYREVELDRKCAVESGSSILPSQIKVTIFPKGSSRGHPNAFNNSDYRSQDFNEFYQKTQRSYRGRGGALTNNFSKSMSRLSPDGPYPEDGSHSHQNRYGNTNGTPYAHRGVGRRAPPQQQQPPMDERRRGGGGCPGRFNRPPVPPGGYNSGRKVRIEEDFPPATGRAWNKQVSNYRKGPKYGNQSNGLPPRDRDLREFLNSARSMPALDDVDSYGDPRSNRHPGPHSNRRQQNSGNYQNSRLNDVPPAGGYGPRNPLPKRSFPVPSDRQQNQRFVREANVNGPRQRLRSSSRKRLQSQGDSGGRAGGQSRAQFGVPTEASGAYTTAWPPAPLPCDASGKWVRGRVRCSKHEIAVGTACETEGDNHVHVCASCGCAKVETAPEHAKPDADGEADDEAHGSIESLHCASNDEYIDDNPLDDLDQFTLKIDMDGGFVVHDASICDPILQKPIRSWIDEELSEIGLDLSSPPDEPEPLSDSLAVSAGEADADAAVAFPPQSGEEPPPPVTLSSSLPLSVECSIFSAAQSSSSGVSTLSSRLSVGCGDVSSVEAPLRRVVSAEQVDKVALNRTMGPNFSMR